MGTPVQKEFGPGYDYPNRKFHFWAVILPTVLITALAVVVVRHTATPSSRVTRSTIMTCPTQTCPPPGSADSTKAATKTSSPAAGLNAAQTTVRDSSSPTVTSVASTASSQPSNPSPSSNLSPSKTSPSPSSSSSPSATSSPSVTPVLNVTRAMLSQESSVVTHAVILSSA
jgi:hypothetical protein